LEVENFQDQTHWDWVLKNAEGTHLTGHQVRLDPRCMEYKAMTRLQFSVRWYSDGERPLESEAEFLDRVGHWMGAHVLGDVGEVLVRESPVTVLVVVPAGAEVLRHQPLELAWVGGRPIALQDVSLILDVTKPGPAPSKTPIGKRLRMLAVFSLPTKEPLLVLSQQRYELVRSIKRIATTRGKSVHLVTLQYGVTRGRLGEILEEGEGWDVIHFSGHGLATQLVLEGSDGEPDPVSTEDLLDLLRRARRRLKLLVLSSCDSAAAAASEAAGRQASSAGDVGGEPSNPAPLPALAVAAAQHLDCAVLGMCYLVGDDFSIQLAHHLYDSLFDKGNLLPRALQLALPKALEDPPTPGNPALSVATPVLFGDQSVRLSLAPPEARPDFALQRLKMSYFRREPDLFVGRVEPMAAASRALAPESRHSGVLFHAPDQTGKTACALELAYLHEEQFGRLVWHLAPARDDPIAGALVPLADALETQLEGFGSAMKDAVTSRTKLKGFLPRLTELMEQNAILIVIDGIETLLTPEGAWKDDFWQLVVNALLDHDRVSRLVLTSRWLPTGRHQHLCVVPVRAMSPIEALLLARQLPRLGAVLRGHTNLSMERAAPLLADTLTAAGGLPGLIRKADKKLTSPDLLDQLPARMTDLAQAAGLHDAITASREEYVRLVADWIRGITRPTASPTAPGGDPAHPSPPPPGGDPHPLPVSPPPADVHDGLSDKRFKLLRASAVALEQLMSASAELRRIPLADSAELYARMQRSFNDVKQQLIELEQQVTITAWPHPDWAIEFSVARARAMRDIQAVEEHPSRATSGPPFVTTELDRRLCGSVAELTRLLKKRYPGLFRQELPGSQPVSGSSAQAAVARGSPSGH
jgi:hypothetical protein